MTARAGAVPARCLGMRLKGVLVVSETPGSAAAVEPPGTQQVANRPIACHALESLAAAGAGKLAVIAPEAVASEVRRRVEADLAGDLDVTFLPQRGRLDFIRAMETAAGFVGDDPAVMHSAEGLLGQRLDLASGAVNGDRPDLLLLLHRSCVAGETLNAETQKLLGVTELSESRSHLALAGACTFGPGVLRRCAQTAGRIARPVDLIGIAQYLVGEGATVEATVVQRWRRYAGDPADLLELNRIVLDEQAPHYERFEQHENRIEGRVVIHPTAQVTSSVILGPSIIGRGARVSDAYIGPYTSIGAEAEIEGAEIVRSIVSERARIMHVPERIEGSTIGRGASIFRDFGLPRAMRLHVGDGVEVVLN